MILSYPLRKGSARDDREGWWLPFLDTYRTMCLAPPLEFWQVLEEVRELSWTYNLDSIRRGRSELSLIAPDLRRAGLRNLRYFGIYDDAVLRTRWAWRCWDYAAR